MIDVGIPVFERTDKVCDLLRSLPLMDVDLGTVYIADDGHTEEREELYRRDWSFDLDYFDVEYNVGLAAKRNYILDRMETEYVLFLDSDHLVPPNLSILRDQLEANPELGALAGAEVEPERGLFNIYAHDFSERDNGSVLVRDIQREQKAINRVAGYPIVEFDMTSTPRLFRRECLEELAWDDRYLIGREHIDFYVGHWKQTDWHFGVSPSVIFTHQPGNTSTTSKGSLRLKRDDEETQMFLDKWGYDDIIPIHEAWVDSLDTRYPSIEDLILAIKRRV
jgi:glycosyltransferase involved in cell wall biosynthesis